MVGLADLARLTRNSSWVQLAGLFEQPCFVGALAPVPPRPSSDCTPTPPSDSGLDGGYEATGEPSPCSGGEFLGGAHSNHIFATGGSTSGEVWLRAGHLGDAVSHQRRDNYWAHDHAETCVAHNSMRVSRRLLQWSPWSAWEKP